MAIVFIEAWVDILLENVPPTGNAQPLNFQPPNGNRRRRQKVAPAYRPALGDSSRTASELKKKRKCTVRAHKSQVSGVPPRWDRIRIPPVQRNAYTEHVITAQRSELEVNAYRLGNGIVVSGRDAPKPVLSLEEANLPDCLREWLETKNSRTVTSIQAQCWPVTFKGRDLLAVVQDGTEAKAAAYLVPAMAHLFSQRPFKCANGPIALFLVPSREVAREVHQLACGIQEYTKIGVACICCRDPRQSQLEQLEERPQVCIATPGRFLAFLKEGRLNLRRCTYVVFDGLDHMVDAGLEDEVRAIVDWMPPGRQTQIWLNSRTRNTRLLCEDLLDDYVQVSIGVKMALSDQNVEQIAIVCDETEKHDRLLSVLEDILNESGRKVIVFVETKRTVDDVATLLLLRGWPVIGVHGKKKDDKLDWALTAFRDNCASILVCTDVCALKLDAAGDVRYVINYDYPGSSEVYKRRLEHVSGSGRTAVAYTLFTPQDKRHAGHFMSILLEAKQVVPPELRDMAKGTVRNRKLGVGRTGERRVT